MTFTPVSANPIETDALLAGIDTHKHTHHVAIVDHLGRAVADREFATTSRGYAQIIDFLSAGST